MRLLFEFIQVIVWGIVIVSTVASIGFIFIVAAAT